MPYIWHENEICNNKHYSKKPAQEAIQKWNSTLPHTLYDGLVSNWSTQSSDSRKSEN